MLERERIIFSIVHHKRKKYGRGKDVSLKDYDCFIYPTIFPVHVTPDYKRSVGDTRFVYRNIKVRPDKQSKTRQQQQHVLCNVA